MSFKKSFINYCRRLVSLTKLIIQIIELFFKKKKKNILLLTSFEINTGTYTYFLNLLDYFNTNQFQVSILVHIDTYEKIKNNKQLCRYKLFTYSNELNHFEYYFPLKYNCLPLFIDQLFPKLAFILNLQIHTKSSQLFITPKDPSQFIELMVLPIKKYYVVHSILWGKLDYGNQFLLKIGLKLNTTIITVSNSAKKYIETYWGFKAALNSIVIYNCFKPSIKLFSKKDNLKINILSVGLLSEHKNPLLFIKVAQKLIDKFGPCLNFIWVGDGPLFSICNEKTKDNNQIQFVGEFINVDTFFLDADIYFQLSLNESHGLSILSAMYYELPCIVTDGGGPKESILNNISGYVINVNDFDTIILKATNLIVNLNLRLNMGLAAKNSYNQKFTEQIWNTNMNTIMQLV